VKNSNSETNKKNFFSRYLTSKNNLNFNGKSTDVNILLNRVKLNEKNEVRKKFYFSVVASTGLILFGFIIF
tara:strand:- start:140 stop:352 length:213 start_codon:yes stop_codon:yes gene_type:complete